MLLGRAPHSASVMHVVRQPLAPVQAYGSQFVVGCELSAGQTLLLPVHVSWGSHVPVVARHTVPAFMKRSDGQLPLVPVQVSATSHPPSTAGRHVVPAG